MTTKNTRQIRIVELTTMGILGKSYNEIHARAYQMTGSKQTANAYMLEVMKRIESRRK